VSSKSKKALASYGRSFVGAALATFLAAGGDIFSLNGDGLKAIVSAGIAALLPVALRWANPNDDSFGRGA
jgi:hypothetical protein